MKKLIIGIVLVLLGVPGTAILFPDILRLIAGGLPAVLILGGALAVYLGYEEVMAEKEMDALPSAEEEDPSAVSMPATETVLPPETDAPDVQTLPDAAPESKAETVPEQETAQKPAFAGNTDTFVFHSLSCNFSKGKKCTVRFTTRDDAIEEGYKPCKICNP